ncbi:MAG: SCO family protein [Methylobacter sp.]
MQIPNRQIWLTMLLLLLPLSVASQEAVLASIYRLPMNWTDDQGKLVSLDKWQGKPVIISMAYSTCRKFCPLTLLRLAEIQRLYDKRMIDAEFVVISYDPTGDTWQSWAEYRKTHGLHRNNWHFLTGSPEDTKTISQLLGMDYWLYDDHVMHNFKIVRLNPNGEIERTLDWDSQEQIEVLIPEVSKP